MIGGKTRSNSEVDEFDTSICTEENTVGLHILVYDIGTVQVDQGCRQIGSDAQSLTHRQRSVAQDLAQRLFALVCSNQNDRIVEVFQL